MGKATVYSNVLCCTRQTEVVRLGQRIQPGASKGTPGDAKCVTEILEGTKIRKLWGQSLKLLPPDVIL